MKTIFICVLLMIVLSSVWFVYRILYVKRKSRQLTEMKLRHFEGLIQKLRAEENIQEEDIILLAQNPATRHALFGLLDGFGRMDVFPEDFFTLEKSAESFLVNWLEFPTELNSAPDQIQFFTKVTIEENNKSMEYFVYRYKKNSPSPGLPPDWMLGVIGPFGPDSKPYDIPLRIFSRFNVLGTVSALEEVRWVHEHINRK
jgi:hypothetical protein